MQVQKLFFPPDGTYQTPAKGFYIIFISSFIVLALLRCFVSSAVTRRWIGFSPCLYIGAILHVINIASAVATAMLGFLVIYAIIFQAISPYYMLAITEVVLLVVVAMLPGYFAERRRLAKYIPDAKACSRFAMISGAYAGLLSLALIYSLYSVGMNYF